MMKKKSIFFDNEYKFNRIQCLYMNLLTRPKSKELPSTYFADNLSQSLNSEKEHDEMFGTTKDIAKEADKRTDSTSSKIATFFGTVGASASGIMYAQGVFGEVGKGSSIAVIAILGFGFGGMVIYGVFSSLRSSAQRSQLDSEMIEAATEAYKKMKIHQTTQGQNIREKGQSDRDVYSDKSQLISKAMAAEVADSILGMAQNRQRENINLVQQVSGIQADSELQNKIRNLGTINRENSRLYDI